MTRIAVCPGSFDPVTMGHIDILKRASRLYDRVIAGVAVNPRKQPLFSLDERVEFLKASLEQFPNLEVDAFDQLLVDFCRKHGASTIVKGLRAVSDFEFEIAMAQINLRLLPEVETVFLMTRPEFAFLSSSIVKEVAEYGGSVEGLVPNVVEKSLHQHFRVQARR